MTSLIVFSYGQVPTLHAVWLSRARPTPPDEWVEVPLTRKHSASQSRLQVTCARCYFMMIPTHPPPSPSFSLYPGASRSLVTRRLTLDSQLLVIPYRISRVAKLPYIAISL